MLLDNFLKLLQNRNRVFPCGKILVPLCLLGLSLPAHALFGLSSSSASKKMAGFNKVETSSKHEILDYDAQIQRSAVDEQMDNMIEARLGKNFRRANVYDFYPLELLEEDSHGYSDADKHKMIKYYDYARQDLERISHSKLLKIVKLDFDLDGSLDYAVIVRNLKTQTNFLAVINNRTSLYSEPFQGDFVEAINNGNYPTPIIYGRNKKKNVNSPALRIVGFDKQSLALYYDKALKDWQTLVFDF